MHLVTQPVAAGAILPRDDVHRLALSQQLGLEEHQLVAAHVEGVAIFVGNTSQKRQITLEHLGNTLDAHGLDRARHFQLVALCHIGRYGL